MNFFDLLKKRIKGKNIRIVFPEGDEVRIIEAAVRMKKEDLIEPILIGEKDDIERAARSGGFDVSNIEIQSQKNCDNIEDLIKAFFERRKGKVTKDQARQMVLENKNLFGVLLVYKGFADGMVSGAVHSTADTVRPALQVIKTRPEYSIVSGLMVMQKDDLLYFFADCGINVNPNAEQLAEIAAQSDETARSYGYEPKIAMLSFSTNGSAKAEEAEKVSQATKIAKEKYPKLVIDGEMQFDAAIRPEVGGLKFPGSPVAGKANTFVFPTLDAGNIGYKIAQRLGGFEAVGPILQGLNAPVNDLSRGCIPEDVYNLSIVTAAQALRDE